MRFTAFNDEIEMRVLMELKFSKKRIEKYQKINIQIPASLDSIRHQHAIILDRFVATFLELERGITRELLAMRLTIGLGPADLARIALLLECFVAS